MRHRPAVCFLAALLLAGCASAPTSKAGHPAVPAPPAPVAAPAAAPAPTPAPSVPADDGLVAVLWTQRAIEHDFVFREVYHTAEQKLVQALAQPDWDALPHGEREGSLGGLPPAVILDVDETVLDNSPYQAQLIHTGKEYGEFTWSQWCRKAAAQPLAGAVEFTRFAAEHGVTVYYVTNRAQDLGSATLDNLRKAGFPVASDDVFLGLGTLLPGCEMVGTDKGCRRRLVGRGHRVLMQFGDSVGDFVDIVSNTPERRGHEMEPYADWIGERWFVLPNPMYGSWQAAVFRNDWTLSREKRREAEVDALRVE
jgi:5'-nucleotidase (lipoprotein e(P4) family)